jgi:hypothetical protein
MLQQELNRVSTEMPLVVVVEWNGQVQQDLILDKLNSLPGKTSTGMLLLGAVALFQDL